MGCITHLLATRAHITYMTTQLSPITVKGDDGNKRCPWCVSDPQYMNYHDTEWGKPITDDQLLYEKLCLEGFQAGLSWLTILRKRENFREAFQGFDPEVVAQFRSRDITRLMKNEGIVRNRMKIEATIANAKATLNVQDQLGTLSSLIWSFAPTKPKKAPRTLADVPATSPESVAMSKELLKRGFKFVGPTTMYAAMQSLGLVNDHLATCFARK
jgi:DNA-3-methyladenine glycosylase I